jgi:hypothetical protein
MSDPQTIGPDPDGLLSAYEAWEAEVDKLVPDNKARLLAFLSAAGITRVTIGFDGSGDSGQIEDIVIFRGEETVEFPAGQVEVLELPYGMSEPVARSLGAQEAIETLCFSLLARKHSGWEDSDGAYGEFEIDVTGGTIALDFNERYTDPTNYSHSW